MRLPYINMIFLNFVTKIYYICNENIFKNQMQSSEKQIEMFLLERRKGKIYFTSDFRYLVPESAIRMALSRLVKNKTLIRLAQGIFYYPKTDRKTGITLLPSIEDIAEALAKRDKARIVPTGAYAMNKLGLSTQVPMKVVFLTDNVPRKVKVGRTWISFQKAATKNFAYKSYVTMLASFALSEIGKDNVTTHDIEKIASVLLQEDKEKIKKDMALMPAWIRKIIENMIYGNKQMA